MSAPDGIGARRPLRTAGFALLGLSAVAALVGLLVVVTGGEPESTGRPAGLPTGSTTTGSTTGHESPTPSAGLPSSASPSASTAPPGVPAAPTPASPPAGGPGPSGAAGPDKAPAGPGPGAGRAGSGPGAAVSGQRRGELRVYNNSRIQGLAAQAANDLAAAGWTVLDVGNYPGGRIWTTTVYYQNSDDQRAIAQEVGEQFGMRVEPRFAGIEDATPGVIVIVTDDYGT